MRRRRTAGIIAAAAAVSVVGFSIPGASAQSGRALEGPAPGTAKNIILLIGDGLGYTHVDAARIRYQGARGALNMEQLATTAGGAEGSVSTYSVQQGTNVPDYVPDSAPTATAWSSGVKSYDNAIGVDTNGNRVDTIMELADLAGMRTGNVTTSEVTDATPAAMFSHVARRACQGPLQAGCGAGEQNIAEQVARNNTADVILGGGLQRFEPDDAAALRSNGYIVLGSFGDPALAPGAQTSSSQRSATRNDLNSVRGRNPRVIGLFNRGNMTVELNKQRNPGSVEAQNEPTLPEMTQAAIRMLGTSSQGRANGFFLQVEGSQIDKRSHANDAAQTLEETRQFDLSVAAARAYAATPEGAGTLIIVTADHECAGFNIIDRGTFTNPESTVPPPNGDAANPATNSTPARSGPFPGVKDPNRSTTVDGTAGGAVVPINAPNSPPNNFAPATFRTADDPAGVADGTPGASLWLTYMSGNHTGADVPMFAGGPNAATFDEFMDQTEIFRKMYDSLSTRLPAPRQGFPNP